MDALRSRAAGRHAQRRTKVTAMQIIDELEPVKRGGYGGAIGYLSYTGDLDTCIHIRTVVLKDGRAHMQAAAARRRRAARLQSSPSPRPRRTASCAR